MAIRRVTGAVSPSELVFADANALGATYDGSGTTIERGETFTLPAGGTTAVSNGALRLEALKGDCTITNNGNSTLTNASGVNGTILMRSGASDFPAFVKNSSMGSMSTPAREDFTGTTNGTIGSSANLNSVTFPAGHVLQVVSAQKNDAQNSTDSFAAGNWTDATGLSVSLTPSSATNYLFIQSNVHGSNSEATYAFATRLYISGGGTDGAILIGNTMGSRSRASAGGPASSVHFLINYSFGGRIRCNDSTPNWSSGALTIKVQFATNNTSYTARLNRAGNQGNNSGYTTTSSNLTVMEIKG